MDSVGYEWGRVSAGRGFPSRKNEQQDEKRWFMCFRTEVSFANSMPQLGHFTEDIDQEGDRQTRDREGQSAHGGKFPTVIPFSQLILTMDSTNPDSFESLFF